LARVTKETNEIQKRFWKKEGMVDFNTKREVTVEKSQARTGVVRAVNNGMRITRRGRYILYIRCSFYDFLF